MLSPLPWNFPKLHGKPIAYHVGIFEYADKGSLAGLLKKGAPDYRPH
jgi:hypothetical protein